MEVKKEFPIGMKSLKEEELMHMTLQKENILEKRKTILEQK